MDVNELIDKLYKIEEFGKPRSRTKKIKQKKNRLNQFATEARDNAWKAEEIAKTKL
tara:strand:+ start:212 stop:379 length:168 start_codon:yes stop_codon:yes gene_type:complete